MLVREMFDRVLVETGQFILDSGNLEIDRPRFMRLVRSSLGIYSKHDPVTHRFNVTLTGSSPVIEFTDSYVDPVTSEVIGIPDWVSTAIPIRSRGPINPFYYSYGSPGSLSDAFNVGSVDLVVKDPIPFQYRKPRLFLAFSGVWDIKTQHSHAVTGEGEEAEVTTIDESQDEFFNILQAKFLISIGRNRRAFTLQPMELLSDGAELVSEGQRQLEEAQRALESGFSSFYAAWD